MRLRCLCCNRNIRAINSGALGDCETDATTASKIGKIVGHHAAAVVDAANYVRQDPVLTLADYCLIIQSELDALNGLDDAGSGGGDEVDDASPAPLV